MSAIQTAIATVNNLDAQYPIELISEQVASLYINNVEGTKIAFALNMRIEELDGATLDIYKGMYNDDTMQKDNQTESNTSITLVDGNNILEFDCTFPFVRLDITALYGGRATVINCKYITK